VVLGLRCLWKGKEKMMDEVQVLMDKLFSLYRMREQGAKVNAAIAQTEKEIKEALERRIDGQADGGDEGDSGDS